MSTGTPTPRFPGATRPAGAVGPRSSSGRAEVPAVAARVAALLAALWSVVFTVLHAMWALGSHAFLGDSPAARAAFASPVFATYNGVVVLLCAVGVLVALLLPRARVLRPVPARSVTAAAWTACALLLARGGVGVTQTLLGAGPPPAQRAAYDFDPWFLLGGVLFGLAVVLCRHACGPRRPVRRAPAAGPQGVGS